MELSDIIEGTSDGCSIATDVVLTGNLDVRQLYTATLCHDLGGEKLPSLGIDGGASVEGPFKQLVNIERELDNLDAKGLQLVDLATGARVPSLDSLLLLVNANSDEVVKVFCGRPKHADDRFLHGEILSVVVLTNTVADRGGAASLSMEGGAA